MEVRRSERGRTGLHRQALAVSGEVHRRHIAFRDGERRPYLWRLALRVGEDRPDRVSQDAVRSLAARPTDATAAIARLDDQLSVCVSTGRRSSVTRALLHMM